MTLVNLKPFISRVAIIVWLLSCVGAATAPTSEPAKSPQALFDFYATNLRGSLFAGFLTLGSFLAAVNTFVIVNLKKEVYDHEAYVKRVSDRREIDGNVTFYGPLRRLSALMIWTIICSLLTATIQLTIGVVVRYNAAAVVCLAAAAFTMALLFFALWIIRRNLKEWFTFWEAQACKKDDADKATLAEQKIRAAKAAAALKAAEVQKDK